MQPGAGDGDMNSGPLLSVTDLNVDFQTANGVVHAVRTISLEIHRNQIFSLVGESGSGKTAAASAIAALLPANGGARGKLIFDGEDLLAMSSRQRRLIAGERIGYVSQDALAALNPCTTVGFQIAESLMVRRGLSRRAAFTRAGELLDAVGIRDPLQSLDKYPHQFSGGMRQRALIAVGLALEPELLIADEPTTALDVTVTVQILNLLLKLQKELGMSMLLITHDMGVVSHMGGQMAVMNAGQIVDSGPVAAVLAGTGSPITKALLDAVPTVDLSRFDAS